MYIYIYYPLEEKQYFTVVIDNNFNLYWQASQFMKIYNLTKNVKKILYRYLSRDENIKRFKDVTNHGNCNNYALTTDQALRLIDNIRPKHQNARFEGWFLSVIEGRQMLYPKSPREYIRIIENPFLQKGFSALCIDLNRTTTTVSEESSPAPATTTATATANNNPNTTFISKIEIDDEEEEEGELSIIEDPEQTFPNPPSCCSSSTFPNPPSCSSIYSQEAAAPSKEKSSINEDFLFTLPVLIQYLKSKFGSIRNSNIFPPSNEEQQSVPQCSSSNNSQPFKIPPEFSTSGEQQQQPINVDDDDENEMYPLEVDETKSFVTVDPSFRKKYKFYALKLNCMSGIRHPIITPFYLGNENNTTYLFVPVKKVDRK